MQNQASLDQTAIAAKMDVGAGPDQALAATDGHRQWQIRLCRIQFPTIRGAVRADAEKCNPVREAR